LSVAYASIAVQIPRWSPMVRFCFALSMAFIRFGMATAEMMPMIATTMSSSTRVKPEGPFRLAVRFPVILITFSCAASRIHTYCKVDADRWKLRCARS
jgi:hypothetical protein